MTTISKPDNVILLRLAHSSQLFDDLGITTLRHSESIEIGILHSITGITSISEKPIIDGALLAVVEQHGSELWYPLCYEGPEQSANILYTNTCLNQQIEPGVRWAITHGAQRCQVMVSDDVSPRRRELIQATIRYLPYEIEQVAVEFKTDIALDKPIAMDVALPPDLADLLLRLARAYDDDAINALLLLGSDANE